MVKELFDPYYKYKGSDKPEPFIKSFLEFESEKPQCFFYHLKAGAFKHNKIYKSHCFLCSKRSILVCILFQNIHNTVNIIITSVLACQCFIIIISI